MRWLFVGIVAMALCLVALGTLTSGSEPNAALMEAPARYVEISPAPKSEERAKSAFKRKVGRSKGAPGRPMKDAIALDPSPDEDRRAKGNEGYLGKDGEQRPLGGAVGAARSGRRQLPRIVAQEKAPEVVEEEAEEVEMAAADKGELVDDDDESADAPSPPPPAIAKPAAAPVVVKADVSDRLIVDDAKTMRTGKKSDKAQAYKPASDLPKAGRKGRDEFQWRSNTKSRAFEGRLQGMLAANAERGEDQRLPARLDLSLLGTSTAQSTIEEAPPAKFLPRMCYFENTYLGGNAAWQEQLRRVRAALGHLRPLQHARLDAQAFDPPADAGMALTASLDHAGLQQPGRVVLQVGLQGSQRYGWRRPPLDVVLVVDGPASDLTHAAAKALLTRLGPRDRLGIIEAGTAQPLAQVADLRTTRDALVDHSPRAPSGSPAALVAAMDQAAGMLKRAAKNAARIPGSQTVMLLTRDRAAHAQAARAAAHRLQTQGAVVSVLDLGSTDDAGWWAVANAGHGNFHRAQRDTLGDAFDAELAMLSKVVARLLRVNVRLGPHTEGIRVIGSRILGQQEVKAVKAREKATDRNLSKTMGVKANRGDDDDGIQTVIPYFYGGDSHVILVELWVDPNTASLDSAVAEITLKYKDMVNLDNATARAAVFLDRRPKPDARAQQLVKANLAGFAFADALGRAAQQAGQSRWPEVKQTLRNHARTPRDRQVVDAFEALIGQRSPAQMQQALSLASQQRKGTSNGVDP